MCYNKINKNVQATKAEAFIFLCVNRKKYARKFSVHMGEYPEL